VAAACVWPHLHGPSVWPLRSTCRGCHGFSGGSGCAMSVLAAVAASWGLHELLSAALGSMGLRGALSGCPGSLAPATLGEFSGARSAIHRHPSASAVDRCCSCCTHRPRPKEGSVAIPAPATPSHPPAPPLFGAPICFRFAFCMSRPGPRAGAHPTVLATARQRGFLTHVQAHVARTALGAFTGLLAAHLDRASWPRRSPRKSTTLSEHLRPKYNTQ